MDSESRTTLAAEVAAELELTLPQAAERLAEKLGHLKTLTTNLARLGLVRRIELAEEDAITHDIAGIAASASSLPAFGGLLFGTVVHTHRLTLAQRTILDANEQVRVYMGDLDFYESGQRLRWKQTQHLFEMLGELVHQPERPQVILLDQPILISRGQEGNRELIEEVQEEWIDMVDVVNTFWRDNLARCLPSVPNGIVIASVMTQNALPLFLALRNNPATSVDEVDAALPTYIQTEWTRLRQAGMTRILDKLLPPQSRTIAFGFEDLNLDARWQPEELHHSGIQGFFLRAGPQAPIWQVQIAGHQRQWTSEHLDRLASKICRATLGSGAKAEPLPLWYARRLAAFPRGILEVFRELAHERIES